MCDFPIPAAHIACMVHFQNRTPKSKCFTLNTLALHFPVRSLFRSFFIPFHLCFILSFYRVFHGKFFIVSMLLLAELVPLILFFFSFLSFIFFFVARFWGAQYQKCTDKNKNPIKLDLPSFSSKFCWKKNFSHSNINFNTIGVETGSSSNSIDQHLRTPFIRCTIISNKNSNMSIDTHQMKSDRLQND